MIESDDEKRVKMSLDNLFEEVKSFRYAKEVRALFDYCRKMQHLSAYNAALVYTQQPGNRLVLTAKQWYKENRLVKPNARPLIILIPFGPVGFVYDISDTEPIHGKDSDDERERLIDLYINHPFKSRHRSLFVFEDELKTLLYNMTFYGIKYETMRAGSNLAASIEVYDKSKVEVPLRKKDCPPEAILKHRSRFWVGVNDKADPAEELANLTHELGHLFCHHLYINDSWWKLRKLELNSKEFEAESASCLVCSRLGIDSRSVEYLSGYKDDDEIPPVSFENIFTAVTVIEKMLNNKLTYRDGYLYKYDKSFKEAADKLVEQLKR